MKYLAVDLDVIEVCDKMCGRVLFLETNLKGTNEILNLLNFVNCNDFFHCVV